MGVKTVKIGYATSSSGQDSSLERRASTSPIQSSKTSADLPEPFPSPRIPALGKTRLPNVPPARYIGSMRHQAKVKAVMSGDTLILSSIENPDRERTLSLAYCTSPHLKKEGDEPFAFDSRDALRKMVVGKNVQFLVLYQIPNTKREYGIVYMNDGRQLPEEMVKEGWLKLREDAGRKEDSEDALQQLDKLRLLEATARSEDKGLWAPSGGRIELQHDMGDSQTFLETYKGKTVDGLVERVFSGDRMLVRLMISPTKHIQGMKPLDSYKFLARIYGLTFPHPPKP
jgi:staphylococcal nuclease domain-containing protein 1